MSVLTLERVSKRFDRVVAVDDLSFSVKQGSVFGFLGGNGAGKTTSLRMVLDIIRPTSGTIQVLGRAPGRENASDIGFLPEERGLYRQMTALDTITYFGRLKGMATADARREGAAPIFQAGEAVEETGPGDPVERVDLPECRRKGRVDQAEMLAGKIGTRVSHRFQPLELLSQRCVRRGKRRSVRSGAEAVKFIEYVRAEGDPRPVLRPLQRIGRIKLLARRGFLEVVEDSGAFEDHRRRLAFAFDFQDRHLPERRNGEEPIRLRTEIDGESIEIHMFLVKGNDHALHEGAAWGTDEGKLVHRGMPLEPCPPNVEQAGPDLIPFPRMADMRRNQGTNQPKAPLEKPGANVFIS